MSDSDAIVIPSYSNDTDKTDDIFNIIFKNNTHDCSKILNSYIYKCKNDKNKLVFFKEYIEHQLLVIIKLFNLNDDFFKFKKFITFLVILFILKSNDDNDINISLLNELNKLLEKPNNTIENYFDDELNDSENFKYFFKSLKSSKTDENYKNTYDIVINNRNNNCISNLYNELIFKINNIEIQENSNFNYTDLNDDDKLKIENINFCIHNNFNLKKTNKEIGINQYESYISSYSYLYLDNKETPYLVQVSNNNIITLYLPIKVNDTQLILNIHTKEVSNITNFIHNFISGNNRPIEAKFKTWDTENYLLEKIYLPFEYNLNRKDIIIKTFIIKNEKYKYDPYIFKISSDNINENYEYFLKVFYIVNNDNKQIKTHNLFISYNYSKLVVYNSKTKKIFVFNLEVELINTNPLLYHHRNEIYNVEKIINFCNKNNNTETENNIYDINEIVYYYDDTTKISEPTYKDPYFKDDYSKLEYESDLAKVYKFIDDQNNEFILKIHDDYKKNPLITLTEKEKNKKQFYFHYFNSSNPEKIIINNMQFIKIDFLYKKINNDDKLIKKYKLYNLYYCNDKKIYLVFVMFKNKYVGKFFTEIYLNDNYYYIDLNNKYIYNLNDFCRNFIIMYNNQDKSNSSSNKEFFIYHKDKLNNSEKKINDTIIDVKETSIYIINISDEINIKIFYNIKINNEPSNLFISNDYMFLLIISNNIEYVFVYKTHNDDEITYESFNTDIKTEIIVKKNLIVYDSNNPLKLQTINDTNFVPKKKIDIKKKHNYTEIKNSLISNEKIKNQFPDITLNEEKQFFTFDGYKDIIFYKIEKLNGKECNNIYISYDTNIVYVYFFDTDLTKEIIYIYTQQSNYENKDNYIMQNYFDKLDYDYHIFFHKKTLEEIIISYGKIYDNLTDKDIYNKIKNYVNNIKLLLYVDLKNDFYINYLKNQIFVHDSMDKYIDIKYNQKNTYIIYNHYENIYIHFYKIDKIFIYSKEIENIYIIDNIYISLNAKIIYIFNNNKYIYKIFYRSQNNSLEYYYYDLENDSKKIFLNFEQIILNFYKTNINTENLFYINHLNSNEYRENFKNSFVFTKNNFTVIKRENNKFFKIKINDTDLEFFKITKIKYLNISHYYNNIYIEKNRKYILILIFHNGKPTIRCFEKDDNNKDEYIYILTNITNIEGEDYIKNIDTTYSDNYNFDKIIDSYLLNNRRYHFDINDVTSIKFNIIPHDLVGQAGGNNDDQDNVLYAIIIILINRILLLNKDEKLKLIDEISNFKF